MDNITYPTSDVLSSCQTPQIDAKKYFIKYYLVGDEIYEEQIFLPCS
jgi:hypothetical protein